jgi:hypothetical protein
MICQKCFKKEAVSGGYRCEECLEKLSKLCGCLVKENDK